MPASCPSNLTCNSASYICEYAQVALYVRCLVIQKTRNSGKKLHYNMILFLGIHSENFEVQRSKETKRS